MKEACNDIHVALHEAGHAFGYWIAGGKITNVCGSPPSATQPGRVDFADSCNGYCSGDFNGSTTSEGGEKYLQVLFAGGLACEDPQGTGGDVKNILEAVAWAAKKHPGLMADAIGLVQADEPSSDDLQNFFSAHCESFKALLDENAMTAIQKLAEALVDAPGRQLSGKQAAEIFEKHYPGKIPGGVMKSAFHGHHDTEQSPEEILQSAHFFLDGILKKIDNHPGFDVRLELVREGVVRTMFDMMSL